MRNISNLVHWNIRDRVSDMGCSMIIPLTQADVLIFFNLEIRTSVVDIERRLVYDVMERIRDNE